MKRPWQVWIVFVTCAVVLLSAMAWLTKHALRVDRLRAMGRAEAKLEGDVNLALWRMDTLLAPLIAAEIARPHFFYDSFIWLEGRSSEPNRSVAPSPLLTGPEANVLLNFDVSADGQWRSPQAPADQWIALACSNGLTVERIDANKKRLAELASQVDVRDLVAQLPEQPLPSLTVRGLPGVAGVQQQQQEAEIFEGEGVGRFYGNSA
ncbi:MAG: hypothetical protein AAF961_15635, partial [Planctomycetota bacterium]